jgi:lysophospholipase L1-like esterase
MPAAARPVRLCVVGDSISEGFSPATHGWSTELGRLHADEDFGVKNTAHSGDKVAAARILFDRNVVGRGCTHVAILIGTNDLPDGTSADAIFTAIDSMASAAEEDGAKVLLLGVLPRGTGAAWSSDLQARLVALNGKLEARSGSLYVDTYTALLEPASSPPALASAAGGAADGLHPNNAGQAMIAQAVEAAVLAAGGW